MNDDNVEFISNQDDLDQLIKRFDKKELFASEFKFAERGYFIKLLTSINIYYKEFEKNYFYFSLDRQLHISESEFGNVWISTIGLVARNKVTNNSAVNACVNQHTVISLLLEKSIEISSSKNVYDIDSYNFGVLSELSPALFHNSLFFIEVFCKAYLSLCGIKSPFTHKLSAVYSKVVETMYAEKHNDSLFQELIVEKLAPVVEHVTKIPGDFKEHFVKYDDNPDDSTVIVFQPELLNDMKSTFVMCVDFITDYFHVGAKTHYLKQGLYQRLLDKAENQKEKNRIVERFNHLIINPNEL